MVIDEITEPRKETEMLKKQLAITAAIFGLVFCAASLTARAQAGPQVEIEKEIAIKADELKLGQPLSGMRRTTSVPPLVGWRQEFAGGRVYWTALARARGVSGDILARFIAEGEEQGPLGYPLTDELPEGDGSRNRRQGFTGGIIYWNATTRQTTVKRNEPAQTLQVVPNYSTTAPGGTVEAAPNYATVAGLRYTIPGQAGRKWIDTGLDVNAGAMVDLFAEGNVDYGPNLGTLGPAGVAASGVSGLPAETISRYGLVARVTSSRTNPEDDLHEDYAYGERKEFCSRAGGRLWLTVNDKEPNDNKGEYNVEVKLGVCPATPAPRPMPDPGRGTFRVKIIGFRVEHVAHDGLLDAGDDAYLMRDAAQFNADGRFAGDQLSGQSLVYGDIGRSRAHVQAGTQGDNGGLKAGDEIKGRSDATSPNRLPILVGDFELVNGANAVVFSPTIWIANNETGNYPHLYRQRVQSRVRFTAYDVRHFLETNAVPELFHWGYSLSRGPDDWFEMLFSGRRVGGADRPVGLSYSVQLGFLSNLIDDTPSTLVLDFVPHTFLLTYKTVTDFIRSAGGGSGQREVRFEAQYRDSGPHGVYTIVMTIERLP
jgi:hypothetical protein